MDMSAVARTFVNVRITLGVNPALPLWNAWEPPAMRALLLALPSLLPRPNDEIVSPGPLWINFLPGLTSALHLHFAPPSL